MQLTLARLTAKQQAAAGLGVSAVLVGCFHVFWVIPAQAAIALQQEALTELRSDITRGVMTERSLPDLRRQRDALQVRVASLHAVGSPESESPEVLRHAQAIAEDSELWITGFKPGPAVTREHGMERSVTLEFDGTYAALVRFLQAMAGYPPLVIVTGLRLRTPDRPADGATLTGACRLTTFVPSDTPAAAGGAGGAAKPVRPSGDAALACGEGEATTEALP